MFLIVPSRSDFNKTTNSKRIISLPTLKNRFKNNFLKFVFTWRSVLVPNCKLSTACCKIQVAIEVRINDLHSTNCWNSCCLTVGKKDLKSFTTNDNVLTCVVIYICSSNGQPKAANFSRSKPTIVIVLSYPCRTIKKRNIHPTIVIEITNSQIGNHIWKYVFYNVNIARSLIFQKHKFAAFTNANNINSTIFIYVNNVRTS